MKGGKAGCLPYRRAGAFNRESTREAASTQRPTAASIEFKHKGHEVHPGPSSVFLDVFRVELRSTSTGRGNQPVLSHLTIRLLH